ncbi:MAG: hypothetical protein AAGI70_03300 [Pseudomonadota bacterium]
MPGTVKIWWHQGALRDHKYNSMPVLDEPELARETVTLSGAVETSGPAPEEATLAVIQTDVDVAYVVRRPGESVLADATLHKPVAATGTSLYAIGVNPGYSLSLVELG